MTIKENQYYIVRGDRSGVFAGNIVSQTGREVTMSNVLRIWYWEGACSISQLASEGTKAPKKCKFTIAVYELTILDAIEIIPCTKEAEQSIKDVAIWRK